MLKPDAREEVIEHSDQIIKFGVTHSAQGQTLKQELYYNLDGSESKNYMGGIGLSSKAAWEGNVLVIRSELKAPQGTVNTVSRLSLSTDGKTLTNDQRILSGRGGKTMLVLDRKQE